jgi:DMSO/TMAO reductase YedYZ molybdopterin-dependent catalytic subunit
MHAQQPSRRLVTVIGAGAGVVAGAVALGVAELTAGLRSSWQSPIVDVGDRVVDNVPPFVKDFAIETFGTNDKPALLVGIGIVLAVYAAIVGVIAFRWRLGPGLAGIGVFGLIGAVAARSARVGGTWGDAVPAIVGTLAGGAALWLTWRLLAPSRPTSGDLGRNVHTSCGDSDRDPATHGETPTDPGRGTRRELLVRAGGLFTALAVAGGVAGAAGRALRSRFSAAESRAALRLPAPDRAPSPPPSAIEVGVEGMEPFFTPNGDFYRIDTALTVPQLRVEDDELRVTGMVERPMRLRFDDLLARDVVEHDITLTCVSNPIGGELVGTARWLGVRLDALLDEAGVDTRADQVVGRSIDGYTCGFPLEAARDGRYALVAFGMNGEPLPLEHGFPVRLVVPGLYGYVSATKWLTEIELTRFDEFEQYWVPRGYADRAPIKVMSRIDSVDGLERLARQADGTVAIGGVAWAQTRGIAAVEVQIDDGDWQRADLGAALNEDTWRQWAFRWTPSAAGRTSLRCRAISEDGEIQTPERSEPLPDGATGHHQIVIFVE